MPLMKEKRFDLGGLQIGLAISSDQAARISGSPAYNYLVRLPMSRVQRLTRGHGANGTTNHASTHGLSGTTELAAPISPVASEAAQSSTSPEAQAVLDRIQGIEWYHTINLPHGITTPGFADHRRQVPLYGLPEDMRGLRALDVATYDGFWAFEMERRGAEVTAIDLETLAQCDFPRRFRHHSLEQQKLGAGFQTARELLGSKVERKLLSVYDLSPDHVGTFDVVFVSDLLLHLRDGALALEKIATVTKPSGFALVAEPHHVDLEAFREVPLSQFGWEKAVGWWQHSATTIKTMLWAAGFDNIVELSRFRLNCKAEIPLHKVVFKASGNMSGALLPDTSAPEIARAEPQTFRDCAAD